MPAKRSKTRIFQGSKPLDTTRLYDCDQFADLTINFSGRKVKAHRVVLCIQSEYFSKLCNPNRGFTEANANEITLHDDDPDAMEAVLRHLYGFENDTVLEAPGHTGGLVAQATYALQVIITADKYGVEGDFIDAAESLFDRLLREMEDPREIMSILKMCTVGSDIHPLLASVVDSTLDTHMMKLTEIPEWYDWIYSLPSLNKEISQQAAEMRAY